MTEQEALALGKKLYENIKHGADNIIETSDFIEYVEKSNVALEKQIAKKPHRRYFDAGNFKLVSCSCGVCEAHIAMRLPNPMAYCSECGQKLDWGNEDAE